MLSSFFPPPLNKRVGAGQHYCITAYIIWTLEIKNLFKSQFLNPVCELITCKTTDKPIKIYVVFIYNNKHCMNCIVYFLTLVHLLECCILYYIYLNVKGIIN